MYKVFLFLILCSFKLSVSHSQISADPDLEQQIQDIFKDSFAGRDSLAKSKAAVFLNENPNLDCQQVGRLNKIIFYSLRNQNKTQKAIDWLNNEVLGIWNNCKTLPKKYLVEPNVELAELYGQLNDYNNTINSAQKVFNLYNDDNGKGPKYEARAYLIAGHAYSILGDELLAERYYFKGSKIIDSIDDEYWRNFLEYLLVNYRSVHYKDYGKYAEAIVDLEKGIDLTKLFFHPSLDGEAVYDELIMRCNMASCFIEMKDYQNAKTQLGIINKYEKTLPAGILKAEFVLSLIEVAIIEEDQKTANQLLKDHQDFFNTLDITYNSRIQLLKAKLSNKEDTKKHFESAINSLILNGQIDFEKNDFSLIGKRIYNYEVMYDVLYSFYKWKKNSYLKDHHTEEAFNELILIFDQLDYLITQSRSSFSSEHSRINQLQLNYNIYEDLISLLSKSNNKEKVEMAMFYCLKNKGNELNKNLELKRGLYDLQDTQIKDQIADHESKVRNLEYQLATTKEEVIKDSLNTAYIQQLKEYNQFKFALEKSHPKIYQANHYTSNEFSLKDIKNKLSETEMLIEVFYGKEEVFIFGLQNTSCQVHYVTRSLEIDSLIEEISQLLINEGNLNTYKEKSNILYNLLYKQILHDKYASIDHIYTVPDGKLNNIPFDAFWDGSKYLIESFSSSMLYNSKMLLSTEKLKFDGTYLGFGTSYSDDLNKKLNESNKLSNVKLAKLPSAELEISQAKEVFAGTEKIGPNASLDDFMSCYKNHKGILHFALHGMILDEYSSAIVFDDRGSDLLLTSTKVYGLDLDNYLSILSACYSADGKIYTGDGVHSLARSFLFAGSRNIVSSLWAASDKANAQIITSFFKEMKTGESLPSSLSLAKRSYLNNASPAHQHPSYWSNLVLVGVGNNSTLSTSMWLWFILGCLLCTVLLINITKK